MNIRFHLLGLFAGLACSAPAIQAATATATTTAATAATAAAASADAGAVPVKGVENSVVRIFSTLREPSVMKPWTKGPQRDVSGSGVVIDGRRILTNAHVVLYATQIQVQGDQAGDRLSATVVAVAPSIDLAVLKLDDPSFFDTHPPLPRSSVLPGVKDAVLTYGFPTGGEGLSITKGIVSRIEFVPYNYQISGLRIQIDAALNPGNSGGPAVVGDRMIGLAFSHLRRAEDIGYIIPNEEIDLFLRQVAAGHPYGKPTMLDGLQTLQNPAVRRFLKLDPAIKGMVVNEPVSGDPSYPLREWDVITAVGGTPVNDEGMVRVNDDLQVRFQYLIQKDAKDGKVPLTIVRGGKGLSIQLPVPTPESLLLPGLQGAYPEYFIFGPLVFSAATAEFVNTLNTASKGLFYPAFSAVGSSLVSRRGDRPAFAGEQLVVISSPFFPDKLVKGYSPSMGRVVQAIDGTPVKNLRQLVQLLRDGRGPDVVIKLQGRGAETLVLPRQETIAATDGILADNDVRAQGSPELLAIWNAH